MNRDRLSALMRRATDGFKAFTPGQRVVAIASVIAVLVGVVLFTGWASTPNYSPLFTNLASKDAAAIVEQLDAAGTSYELADGGQTVMVPKEQVYQLRIQLSADGLPAQDDTGYALLDQQGVTTSEFMQQVGYQRAMEGELANTIKSINGVETATVHLVIPKKDVFSDDSSKPTAAVMVDTASGKDLSADQVQAIVHLVASSVEGLDPDDITVADSTGTVLAAPGGASTGGSGNQNQQTVAFEQRLSSSLQSLLTQVVGTNHAMVKVTADLDFDQSETKTQTYTSDPNTAPLSESTTEETYTGTGTGQNGTGVLGQINGSDSSATGTNGNGSYQQKSTVRDNAVGTVIETRQSAPGKIRKLGVAVLLDEKAAGSVDMAAVKELAASAIGVDTTRGDTLAVTAMPFDQTDAEQAAKDTASASASQQQDDLVSLIKTGAAVLGVVVLLIGTWIATRKRRKRAAANAEELRVLAELQAELERNRLEAGATQGALESGGVAGALGPGSGPRQDSDEVREQKLKEIEALVDDQPDEVARLLRGWLSGKGV
ncbi:flagellar basal-body MS-ring/collar protein FliF [Saccharothrix violaceirubra]|uniref:Flagellar M-ring protein n=1 Tax=Saccharothrix violaceirubra TaxID=413306 RepID=A0A7W7WYE6_9PSEU|nr:flagellar basal-body MS-ring/collar protein FliF [Saccharothrix violaceirubra]MBB4968360.1 flagellar M-ring protein FliF [Saccharothrix violaceirubra]